MDYFITGGAGFIGSHLTLRLLYKGHHITILDNFSTSGSPERLTALGAYLIQGSVLDKELVFSLAEKCDCIIHLAAVVGVRQALKKGRECLRVSYLGTENILDAAVRFDKEIFVASSSAIYGKILEPSVTENSDCLLGNTKRLSWLYSIGKLVEEHLALAYFRELNAKVKIGRFFNVIGPYQSGAYGMVVPTFISKALKDEPLPVYGDGTQTRTFVYIEDALDGLEIILGEDRYGDIYNIGGTEEISILSLAELIKSLTESNSPIELIPYEKAFDEFFEETKRRVPNITHLKKLGYKPEYSLVEALSEIITHYKKMGV